MLSSIRFLQSYFFILFFYGINFYISIYAMQNHGRQLELCANHNGYVKNVVQSAQISMQSKSKPVCMFCDQEILRSNYIVLEDSVANKRIIVNKNPYPTFAQADHLLIMPITHKEYPLEVTDNEDFIVTLSDTISHISRSLYDKSFDQEVIVNWGKMAGQTVPHIHTHFINFLQRPLLLPEQIRYNKEHSTVTAEDVQQRVIDALNACSPDKIELSSCTITENVHECLSCSINALCSDEDDIKNFVIRRFAYNFICISHCPKIPGQVSVIPTVHSASIKDLPREVLLENIKLSFLLFPIIRQYGIDHIRKTGGIHESDGANIFLKGKGFNNSPLLSSLFHVCTMISPRTVIKPTIATLLNGGCKLDIDVEHYFGYLTNHIKEWNI